MRRLASVLALATLAPSTTRADDEVRLRGNYWRDRNTRIFAPEASLRKEYGTGTSVEASYLLDAITSASVSAGVLTDQPFTELRNEVGVRVGQKLGPANVSAGYRYSTESDYWSHTGGVSASTDLLQKNLTLALSYYYTRAEVAQRASAVGYLWAADSRKREDSQLNTHYASLSLAQVLSRRALVEGGYELLVMDGYQANPYRRALVSGNPLREEVPGLRIRHTLTAALRLTPVYNAGALRYLALYAKYRFYTDDWHVNAHAPELRATAAVGPLSLRLTGRYYWQSQADFYLDQKGDGTTIPMYAMGVQRGHCPTQGCYTGDAKLSKFSAVFLEGRADLSLGFLARAGKLGPFFARTLLGLSLGHYWNTDYANAQFGDAWVGGAEIVTPL